MKIFSLPVALPAVAGASSYAGETLLVCRMPLTKDMPLAIP